MDAPERIGLVQSIFGFSLWNRDEDSAYSAVTQYVRADLHEALKAERDDLMEKLTATEHLLRELSEERDALAASNAELVSALPTAIGLVRLKYGNLDPDVSKFLVRAEAALTRLSKGQDNAGS